MTKKNLNKLKNQQKKYGATFNQSMAINKTLSEQRDTQFITDFLLKMRRADLCKSNERKELLNAMIEFNKKYNLNLQFNYKDINDSNLKNKA